VNQAPQGTSNTVTTLENVAYVFTTADFGFSDPNDTPANNFLAVEITTLPGAGTLTDNGIAVTAGQFVSVADINAGLLVFTPAAHTHGTGYASFTFQVEDDGGTADGGANTDPTPRTMTVNVTAVNQAPQGTSNTVATLENVAYVFKAADFGFSDPNDTPANNLLAVEITTLPGTGSLTDNGVAVTAGQFVLVADINAGLLVYTPAAHTHGTGYASFMFQVEDDGGTANGGVNTDPTPRTMTVNVTAVNQAPQGTSNTVTTLENVAYVFQAADFGFSDPNDTPANNLLAVEITTLPGTGSLTDNGIAVTVGQFVSATDISAGKLVFNPAADAHGTGYASFTFQVEDDGGTANGGVNTDPTPRTMTVNVTAVNVTSGIVNPVLVVVPPVPVVAPPVLFVVPPSSNNSPPAPVTPGSVAPIESPTVTLTRAPPERTAAIIDRPTHSSRHVSSGAPPPTTLETQQQVDDRPRTRERPVDSWSTPVETPIVTDPVGRPITVNAGSPEQTELKDIGSLFVQLDTVARQLDSELSVESLASDVISGVLTTASTGYVMWLLRAGPIVASVLSSLPAWRTFDPLPVLDFWERKKKQEEQERVAKDKRHDTSAVPDDAGEETLQTMIS
jgi:hypothetical protein